MKVEFNVEFIQSDKKMAKITLKLPADKQGHLHPMLRDEEVLMFNSYLDSFWGHPYGEYREASIILSHDSWDELKEKVGKFIDGTVRKLKEIKSKPESMKMEVEL